MLKNAQTLLLSKESWSAILKMQNLENIPNNSEIEANTPRVEIMKMEIAGTKIESPELRS